MGQRRFCFFLDLRIRFGKIISNEINMKLFIAVKLRAKEEKVEKIDNTHFTVATKEPPIQGRANRAIIKTLADYLNIAPSRLQIVSGHTSRQKIIEVL